METYLTEFKLNEEAVALEKYYEDFYDDFSVIEIDREYTDKYLLIKGKYLGYYFEFPVYSYSTFRKKSSFGGSYDEYITSKVHEYISKVKSVQDKFTEKNEKEYHKLKNDTLLKVLQKGHVVSNVLRKTGKTSTIKYYAEKEKLPIIVPNKHVEGFYEGFVTFTPEELLKDDVLLSGTYLVDDISSEEYFSILSNPMRSFDFKMIGFVKP